MVSYSEQSQTSDNVIVWDFYTKRKLRIYNLHTDLHYNFQFSYNSQYFSGIKEQASKEGSYETYLFIYELPSLKVVADPQTGQQNQLSI